MQLPIKAHYATVAMLALAQHFASGQLVTARAIADEHDIPAQFLVQILQQLRAAGMITSTRGAAGGFRLERSPAAISVADVVDAVCPTTAPGASPAGLGAASPLSVVAHEVWAELNEIEHQHLKRLKLNQLCQRVAESAESMFYI
ncbi:MAG: RrF2 family transcriptional regulator [Aureliella sp.]